MITRILLSLFFVLIIFPLTYAGVMAVIIEQNILQKVFAVIMLSAVAIMGWAMYCCAQNDYWCGVADEKMVAINEFLTSYGYKNIHCISYRDASPSDVKWSIVDEHNGLPSRKIIPDIINAYRSNNQAKSLALLFKKNYKVKEKNEESKRRMKQIRL